MTKTNSRISLQHIWCTQFEMGTRLNLYLVLLQLLFC